MPRSRRALLPLLGFLIPLSLAPLAREAGGLGAQDVTLPAAGGTGGDPHTLSCGSKAMVGIGGQPSEDLIIPVGLHNLYLLCVDLEADGRWRGSPVVVGKPIVFGGDVGNLEADYALTCPSGTAVSGISGTAGIYVASVQVYCSPLGQAGRLVGAATPLGDTRLTDAQGGAPPFGPFLCPQNLPAKGIAGRAYSWVDRVALVCGAPTVHPLEVNSFAIAAPSMIGGKSTNVTMALSAAAPPGGITIPVDISPAAAASVSPNPVPIAAGQTTGSFVLKTNPVPQPTTGTLKALSSATLPGAQFQLRPPSLVSLKLSSAVANLGSTVTATVTLSGPAFAGGLVVQASSSDASIATVPAMIAVPAGDSTVTFPVSAVSGTSSGCVAIRADFNAQTASAILLTQASVPLGRSTALPLGLSAAPGSNQLTVNTALPLPSPRTISLTSSSPSILAVPASITLPANATSLSVGLTISNPVGSAACVALTAREGTQSSQPLVISLQGASIVSVAR